MSAVFMTWQEISAKIGLCENTIRKWVKRGTFPEPIYLDNIPRFLTLEIEEWILDRAKNRGKKPVDLKRIAPNLKKEVFGEIEKKQLDPGPPSLNG